MRRGALFRCAVDVLLPRKPARANFTRPCSIPGAWRVLRCSASAPPARSAGCCAYYKIPQELLANVSTWGMGAIGAGFFIAFCFLVVGCFLDAIPAIVIVGTVLGAAGEIGRPASGAVCDHLDRLAGVRAGLRRLYGLCLMIACSIAGVRLRYALKDTAIMLVPMLLVLAALIVWPEVSLVPPRLIVPRRCSNSGLRIGLFLPVERAAHRGMRRAAGSRRSLRRRAGRARCARSAASLSRAAPAP